MFRIIKCTAAIALIFITGVTPVIAAMKDPTRPVINKVQKKKSSNVVVNLSKFTLTSTLVAKGRRSAVINNQVVSPGDRIGGATVIAVESNSVKLKKNGKFITLFILGKSVKKSPVKTQ